MKSIDDNIPKKRLSRKSHLPWITPRIKRLIRQKQRQYNMAKRYNIQHDWDAFKTLRKMIHEELRKEHDKYVTDMLEPDTDQNPKGGITNRFWKYVRSKRKDQSSITVLQRPNGTEATDTTEKANILNLQYESVFTKENPSLPMLEESITPSMPIITITKNGILNQLQKVNISKAAGPDQIPTRVLKECATEIEPYLTIIFQQSLDTGCVPQDWKHAKITAIYKKGKRDLAANYRPVSLTSVACKILEHVIFHSVMEHYEQHNILVDHQHGFRNAAD